jgi:hypothetical protein
MSMAKTAGLIAVTIIMIITGTHTTITMATITMAMMIMNMAKTVAPIAAMIMVA